MSGDCASHYRDNLPLQSVVDLILLALEGLGSHPELEAWLAADPLWEHPDLPELLAGA